MQICLLRHGPAEERGSHYPDDDERPLSAGGLAKTEAAAAGFVKLFRPDVILSSPLVRAQQTAEIMKRASGLKRVVIEEALASGDDRALFAALQKLPPEDSVLLVGHQPLLSHTLSNLVAGDPYSMQSTFKKGAAAAVSINGAAVEPGAGTLDWLLQPAQLRAIASA